jgi:transcriptional regulator of acetoin/glycerol metabolism
MEVNKQTLNPWVALRPAIEVMIRSKLPLEDVQEMFSKAYVRVALDMNQGNISRASRAIGVHRNTIYRYAGGR